MKKKQIELAKKYRNSNLLPCQNMKQRGTLKCPVYSSCYAYLKILILAKVFSFVTLSFSIMKEANIPEIRHLAKIKD